jgi:hypothetical protein
VKTPIPAERARRAAVLGIVLPGPPAPSAPPPSIPAPRSNSAVRAPIAGKLTASPALRAKLGMPVAEPPPQPKPEPPAPPAASPPSRQKRYRRAHRRLAARWPAIFSAARPLAIGIDKQVRAIIPDDEISTTDLRVFFSVWTHRRPYSAALERGDRRVNLDGSDAGPAFTDPQQDGNRSA